MPDGRFDCWVVSLQLARAKEQLWVRKCDGVTLREELPVIGMAGASVELLLALDGVASSHS